jgi:hypothetical protein
MRIGIDFGGVIVMPSDGNTPLNTNLGLQIEISNAIDTIQYLIQDLKSEVWIISKASKPTQIATREWLGNVKFYQKTNFNATNLRFCSKRSEKLNICKPLGITHFIDDNIEVLQALQGTVPNLYLFGTQSAPLGITAIKDWDELKLKIK